MNPAIVHEISRVALQTANFNWLFVAIMQDARSFTEHFGWTNSRAGCAQDICFKDCFRCANFVSARDLANECWHINSSGASVNAWRIKAVQAAIRFDARFHLAHW
jgi:hypothetical protein